MNNIISLFKDYIDGVPETLHFLNDIMEENEFGKIKETEVLLTLTRNLKTPDEFWQTNFKEFMDKTVLKIPFTSFSRATSFIKEYYEDTSYTGVQLGLTIPELYFNYYIQDSYLAYTQLKDIFNYLANSSNRLCNKVNETNYEDEFYKYCKESAGGTIWTKNLIINKS